MTVQQLNSSRDSSCVSIIARDQLDHDNVSRRSIRFSSSLTKWSRVGCVCKMSVRQPGARNQTFEASRGATSGFDPGNCCECLFRGLCNVVEAAKMSFRRSGESIASRNVPSEQALISAKFIAADHSDAMTCMRLRTCHTIRPPCEKAGLATESRIDCDGSR